MMRVLIPGKKVLTTLLSVSLSGLPQLVLALPSNGQVQQGSITINNNGSIATINQASAYGQIQWDSFNVNANETVNFIQPGSDSVTLNNILDQNPSTILGQINSNGQVFLSNPNGFIFGAGSRVNVGALLATTSQIDSFDAQTGRINLSNPGTGSIENNGAIHSNGYIGFFAPSINNTGELISAGDSMVLTNDNSGTLYLPGFSGVGFDIENLESIGAVGISHEGEIRTEGGQVLLSSDAIDQTLQAAINSTGIIDVSIAAGQNGNAGSIEILAENGSIIQQGNLSANAGQDGNGGVIHLIAADSLSASGDISARGGDSAGNGGFVDTSAENLIHLPGSVDTTAGNGTWGTWLIDPDNIIINASGSGDESASYISTTYIVNMLETSNLLIEADLTIALLDILTYSGGNSSTLTLKSPLIRLESDINLGANANLVLNSNTLTVNQRTDSPLSLTANSLVFQNDDNASVQRMTLNSDLIINGSSSIDFQDALIRGQGLYRMTVNNQEADDNLELSLGRVNSLLKLTVDDISSVILYDDIQTFGEGVDISLKSGGEIKIADTVADNSIEIEDISTGDIRLDAGIDGNSNSLLIDALEGDVYIQAASNLKALTVENFAGTLNLNGNISATEEINFAAVSDIESSADITLDSASITLTPNDFTSSAGLTLQATGGDVKTGNITANSLTVIADNLLVDGNLITNTAIENGLNLGTTTNAVLQSDSILTGDLVFGQIDSVDGSNSLQINIGDNDFDLQNIGITNGFSSFSLNGNGELNIISSPVISGRGGFSILGSMTTTLANDLTINTSSANGLINLTGLTINGEKTLTLNSGSGDISLGSIGEEVALKDIVVTTAGTINLHDNVVSTANRFDFSSASAIVLFNDIAFGSSEAFLDRLDFGNASVDGTFNLTVFSNEFSSGAIGQNTALQDITLNIAGDGYTLNNDIQAAGGIRIDTTAFRQNGSIFSSGGDVNISSSGDLAMSSSASTRTELGDISLTSETGSVALGVLNASQKVNVDSALNITNAIDDYESNVDTSVNILSSDVTLNAGGGIGQGVESPLVISAGSEGSINAVSGDDIYIANLDNSKTNLDAIENDLNLLASTANADATNQIKTPIYELTSADETFDIYSPDWYTDESEQEENSTPRIYHDRNGWRLGNP
ncbi:beta strand repeat-containing protein [Bacterioplanoides sp.]|uniref:beta strand repeat-containing protein n=1 Tax=Bacterioplanoides sp. TaxID=2066072 RepID=UPI003B00AF90